LAESISELFTSQHVKQKVCCRIDADQQVGKAYDGFNKLRCLAMAVWTLSQAVVAVNLKAKK